MDQARIGNAEVTALGHAGFLVEFPEEKLRLAFDPFEVKDVEPVNYVFVSHKHFDHCDPASIRKLMGDKTKIIAPSSCQAELTEFGDQVEWLDDDQKHPLGPLTYWAIPAYNLNKFRTPTEVFHPKELGGVGFIVEIDTAKKTRLYHAGDTDVTLEMESLKKIDIAFLPISGTYVMTLEEAIQAAELIQPKMAIPTHFGKLLGSSADAYRFQNLLKGKVPVTVLTTG